MDSEREIKLPLIRVDQRLERIHPVNRAGQGRLQRQQPLAARVYVFRDPAALAAKTVDRPDAGTVNCPTALYVAVIDGCLAQGLRDPRGIGGTQGGNKIVLIRELMSLAFCALAVVSLVRVSRISVDFRILRVIRVVGIERQELDLFGSRRPHVQRAMILAITYREDGIVDAEREILRYRRGRGYRTSGCRSRIADAVRSDQLTVPKELNFRNTARHASNSGAECLPAR
jgi:hypothetical protein